MYACSHVSLLWSSTPVKTFTVPPVLNRVEVVDDVRFVVLRRQMVQYIDVENGIEQEAECQRNARSGKGA